MSWNEYFKSHKGSVIVWGVLVCGLMVGFINAIINAIIGDNPWFVSEGRAPVVDYISLLIIVYVIVESHKQIASWKHKYEELKSKYDDIRRNRW